MNFNELGIEKNILRAITEAGYQTPTPIQQKAIPPVLDGHDLLGCAQTGTGKTCAFSVPIIQRLSARAGDPNTVRALILTPTRELALQIYENVCQYARYTNRMATVIFGGVSQVPQVDAIRRGADILIATPGRLWDLMGQGHIKLDKVEFFVLDEADRMLDMGFFPDVKRIIKFIPDERQTLLFSATIPKEIAALADSLLKNPVRIAITPSAKPVEKIEQQLYFVEKAQKRELLTEVIRQKNVAQTLVFTRTKHGADRVARDLNRAGVKAKAIHGDKSQNQRQTALADFKACKIAALVATDIAARGIDINELPLVINFEIPNIPETYVHRIGRTGRAGQEGTAISFCDHTERPYINDIEKLIGRKIPVADDAVSTLYDNTAAPQKPADNRRRPFSENASVAEVMADVKREQAIKPKRRRGSGAKAPAAPQTEKKPAVKAEQPRRKPAAALQSEKKTATPPRRQLAAAQVKSEQRAKAAAPRGGRTSGGGRGRRNDQYARFEKNEPRYDAHTPARSDALSAAAAERIRQKVEAAKAAQRAQAASPSKPAAQTAITDQKPARPRCFRGRRAK